MQILRLASVSVALLAPLTLVACNSSSDSSSGGGGIGSPPRTLYGLLRARGLNTLATAIDAAGLRPELEAAGDSTFFAPTEAAFSALPAGELQRLLLPANQAELQSVLRYHLVAQRYNAATLEGLTSVMSVAGEDLMLDAPGGVLFVNEARVGAADVVATNGLLHEVDALLLPPATILATLDARGFTILAELIGRASLGGALTGANVTLIAPTDAAFLALPAGRLDELRDPLNVAELEALLTFHVLPGRAAALQMLLDGDTANIDGDLIIASAGGRRLNLNYVHCPRFNVPAIDGLIHVASEVLTPTESMRAGLDTLGLTTLAGLIDLAGLDVPLSATGAYTLLAPTDAAFAALPPATLADLQDPINVALRLDFLQRHLVNETLQRIEIERLDDLTMANGQVLVVDPTTPPSVGGVLLAVGDFIATNGMIHQLEEVLP